MALLFFDGFNPATQTLNWLDGAGFGAWEIGRRAISRTYAVANIKRVTGIGLVSAGVIGLAFRAHSNSADAGVIKIATAAGDEHLSLRRDSTLNGQLYVSRNGTTLWTSTTPEFRTPRGSWVYIEFKYSINGTTGNWSLRMNGSDDALYSQTGINTAGQGVTAVGQVALGFSGAGGWVSDYYECDLTGSVQNDFLGDVRIDTLHPTADGSHTEFTPSSGSAHYVLVNEEVADTTGYNSSSIVNTLDSYSLTDLAFTPSVIFGVKTRLSALKADSGSRSITTLIKTEGVEYLQSGSVLSTSLQTHEAFFPMNPNTETLWTATQINALEVGAKVTA